MSILGWRAWHLIFMVTWFGGLFYLPRLFVYHAMADDEISIERFKIMERKLYFGIIWPGGVLTTFCGLMMLHLHPAYLNYLWIHIKLFFVVLLWAYHLTCGYFYRQFVKDANRFGHVFFRIFNEVPVLILVAVVLLAVYKPAVL